MPPAQKDVQAYAAPAPRRGMNILSQDAISSITSSDHQRALRNKALTNEESPSWINNSGSLFVIFNEAFRYCSTVYAGAKHSLGLGQTPLRAIALIGRLSPEFLTKRGK